MSETFKIGDPVIYRGKTYSFPGHVCGITDDGQYIVRAIGAPDGSFAGMKHIYGATQLETRDESPPPAEQMLGWQDISTAPKTGEEFIARTSPEWSSFSCSWDGEMFVHYDRDDGIIAYGPKQWMPMPGPDAAPESPSDLSVGGAERLQDLEHLLESVRACYFVGRPDCPNEFVQSTWEKVKAADDARAALAPAEHVVVTDTMVENALMHEHGIAWDKGSTEDDARAMRNSMRELIDTALTAPPRDQMARSHTAELEAALKLAIEHIEHMAAWISKLKSGYSFEGLGEDMPGLKAALASPAEDGR